MIVTSECHNDIISGIANCLQCKNYLPIHQQYFFLLLNHMRLYFFYIGSNEVSFAPTALHRLVSPVKDWVALYSVVLFPALAYSNCMAFLVTPKYTLKNHQFCLGLCRLKVKLQHPECLELMLHNHSTIILLFKDTYLPTLIQGDYTFFVLTF